VVNIQSREAARKAVREVQAKALAERAQRERGNVEDAATFVLSRGRVAAVDGWEAQRVAQVAAEAARRRGEHRLAAAAAVTRMRGRGELLGAIAELAQTTENDVRAHLKLAGARGAAGGAEPPAADAPGGEGGGATHGVFRWGRLACGSVIGAGAARGAVGAVGGPPHSWRR
jgi:hypothetical protein